MKKISLDEIRAKNSVLDASPLDDFGDIVISPHDMDLPPQITDRLFEHQKVGVDWLYHVHNTLTGGILGDDMGLGKTFQVLSLLCGLYRADAIRKVLVICPVSVIQSWCREVTEHVRPHVTRFLLDIISSDLSKKKREVLLR